MFDGIKFIDEAEIKNKRVLLRVDFNISLKEGITVADDYRIKQSLPTIDYLLKNGNKIILISHLGHPVKRDPELSLKIVVDYLQTLLPNNKVSLVNDFSTAEEKQRFQNQNPQEILMLENIRFYPGESQNFTGFAQELSELADVYVNDAFGVSHRIHASIVGITKHLPSYGGLLLKKEIEIISKLLQNPEKPIVAIIGGTKISTKLPLINKLLDMADNLLVGGGIANVILQAQGINIGKIGFSDEEKKFAQELVNNTSIKNTNLILPSDAIVGVPHDRNYLDVVKKVNEVPGNVYILDIGPETQAQFGSIIAKAKTIVWNGPMGFIEDDQYCRGTDFVYYAITQNSKAFSVVGGGDTLAAISKKEYSEKISHLSTGGGAMLEFIEKGTLPGIEALKSN